MALRLAIIFLAVFTGVWAGEGLGYAEDVEFLQWSSLYYRGKEGLEDIYPVWRKNAEFVREHNSLGLSYSVEMNKFGHMIPNGHVKPIHPVELNLEASHGPSLHSIPRSVDWRKKGVVPKVRNQGQCSSVDAFATVGAIDSFHAIKTGKLFLASEQEFTDCCDRPLYPPESCGYNVAIDGGYNCVVEIGGLTMEDWYKSPLGACLNNSYTAVVKIKGGGFLLSGNETALAATVAMQPVAAAIDASHTSFLLYMSGIYDNPDCSSVELDHMVLIVGYGSQDGKDYWIVQNSWGTDWGMDGYILMSRNKNNQCGIASFDTYPY